MNNQFQKYVKNKGTPHEKARGPLANGSTTAKRKMARERSGPYWRRDFFKNSCVTLLLRIRKFTGVNQKINLTKMTTKTLIGLHGSLHKQLNYLTGQ